MHSRHNRQGRHDHLHRSRVTIVLAMIAAVLAWSSPAIADSSGAVGVVDRHLAGRIAGGANHTCVINDDGSVACWGGNYYGQLGTTTNNTTETPNP